MGNHMNGAQPPPTAREIARRWVMNEIYVDILAMRVAERAQGRDITENEALALQTEVLASWPTVTSSSDLPDDLGGMWADPHAIIGNTMAGRPIFNSANLLTASECAAVIHWVGRITAAISSVMSEEDVIES